MLIDILVILLAPTAILLFFGALLRFLAPRTSATRIEANECARLGAVLAVSAPIWPLVAGYWAWRFLRWLILGSLASLLRLPAPETPRPPIPARWVPLGSRLMGFTSRRAVTEPDACEQAIDALTGERSPFRYQELPRWVRDGEEPVDPFADPQKQRFH